MRGAAARMAEEGIKSYRRGTHRLVDPSVTLRRLRPLMPVFGITRVADLTRLDRVGIPVAQAIRPNSRSLAVSQGKGLDLPSAQVSALMESIETFHGENIDVPMRYGSFEDLCRREATADVASMAHAEDGFDPDERTFWLRAENLLTSEPLLAPVEAFHCDFTLPALPGSGMFQCDTNGLASGNTPSEALIHGLCEVIERDAETLWNLRQKRDQSARAIDLEQGLSPDCQWLVDQFHAASLELCVWDLTTDIGLPVFQCLLLAPDRDGVDPEFGFGCHPSRDVALARALTEAAQVRLTMIAGSRDDLLTSDYDRANREDRQQAARGLARQALQATRSFSESVNFENETLDEDLDLILDRLSTAGFMEVLSLDLTRPEFRIPVMRCVVPGLEPAWEGFDPAAPLSDRALRAQAGAL